MKAGNRYCFIDSIRGFSVLSMVVYHAMYDIVAIYGADITWYFDTPGYIWQQSICWCFIFVSGICSQLGKKPLKHGIIVSLCGLIITAATLVFMPSQRIIMGVLSFLGLASLLMIPLAKATGKISAKLLFVLSALAFFATRNVNSGWFGFENIKLAAVPKSLYGIPGGFVLGFPPPSFYSSDYFSLIPWFFLFAAGYYFWKSSEKSITKTKLIYCDIPILGTIGRKSLIIYMLHQPVTMAALELISKIAS